MNHKWLCLLVIFFQLEYESQIFKICQGNGDVAKIGDLVRYGVNLNTSNEVRNAGKYLYS